MSVEVTDGSDLNDDRDKPVMSADLRRRRRARSIAIALALAVLVVLFYLVTIAKLGPDIMSRPL